MHRLLWTAVHVCGVCAVCVPSLAAGGASCAEAPPKPILWLDFAGRTDEICTDRSGRGNNGRLYGPLRVKTPLGAGLTFDGLDDFIALPDIAFHTFKSLTVEAWVKLDGARQRLPILNFGVDTVGLNSDGGKAAFTVRNVQSDRPTAGAADPLTPGRFHHVVGTYDGHKTCIYVDGTLKKAVPHNGRIRNDSTIGARIGSGLGWPSQTWDHYFRGQMAELKIYDAALTPEQVKSVRETGARGGK